MNPKRTIGDATRESVERKLAAEPHNDGPSVIALAFDAAVTATLKALAAPNNDREACARTLAHICSARRVYFETKESK